MRWKSQRFTGTRYKSQEPPHPPQAVPLPLRGKALTACTSTPTSLCNQKKRSDCNVLRLFTNKYPPAKPGVLHRRVKPWITSARVTSRWYGLPAAKDCYLPPVNGLFRSFPLSVVRLPGLLPTGAVCILLSFYRFSLLYPHSILCTRTPYCDT